MICDKPASTILQFPPERVCVSKKTIQTILKTEVKTLATKPILTRNSSTGRSFAFQKRRSGIAIRSTSLTRST